MTDFQAYIFLCVLASVGLIIGLILATRKAEWEAPARKRKADNQTISTPPDSASYSIVSAWLDDSTQPLDTEALEASLEDEDLPDTSPPESAAVLQAIQYLEDLEG